MSTNINRPTIGYENIAMFQSETPGHSVANNSGTNLSFLPLVQSLEFNFDIPVTNIGNLGTKSFVDQSNFIGPDVNLSINNLETFEDLFSGLFTGSGIRDNLNTDRNFYAIVGDKKGFDASGINLSGAEVLSFGNCFLNNVSISQSVNGLMTSQYSYAASNVQAQQLSGEDITGAGIDKKTFLTGKAPSFDLTGLQLQNIDVRFEPVTGRSTLLNVEGFTDGGVGGLFGNNDAHFNGLYIQVNEALWKKVNASSTAESIRREDTSAGTEDDLSIVNYTWALHETQSLGVNDVVFSNSVDRSNSNPKILQPYEMTWSTGAFIDNRNPENLGDYYSVKNEDEKIIPYYNTSLTISGDFDQGDLIAKSNTIQTFNIEMPINRKTIYGLGKKFPVTRKALFPNACSISVSSLLSEFELGGKTNFINVTGFTSSNAPANGIYFQAGNPQGTKANSGWTQVSPANGYAIDREDTAAGTEEDDSIIEYQWLVTPPGTTTAVGGSTPVNRSDSNPTILQPYESNWGLVTVSLSNTNKKSNLKEFLNFNKTCNLTLSATNNAGSNFIPNNASIRINNAKLISQNYSSSIGSNLVVDMGFSFELNDFTFV